MKDFFSVKRIICLVWVAFLVGCVGICLFNREYLQPNTIADFLHQFKNKILVVYLLVSLLRGFTLFPSTPLVLAGTILYPNEPLLVLFISMVGIIFSSAMIYYFSDYLGFGSYLENKYPQKIEKIKTQLQKPTGFFFVILWSFFPVLPTDAVCYVAGTLRMNFKKYIAAIALGELIICSIYIFGYGFIKNLVN
jgi:uncharacterized membrane protein YdjX (TVP38/TMEM64 family)